MVYYNSCNITVNYQKCCLCFFETMNLHLLEICDPDGKKRFYCETRKTKQDESCSNCDDNDPLFVDRNSMFDGKKDCWDGSDECPSSLFEDDPIASRHRMIKVRFLGLFWGYFSTFFTPEDFPPKATCNVWEQTFSIFEGVVPVRYLPVSNGST